MNSKRIYFLMIGLITLSAIAIIGGTYMANIQLQKQSHKLTSLKLQNKVHSAQQTNLTKAKSDIVKYTALEKIAKVIVPQDKDQAQAVREIIKIATDSGISPTAISFPTSNLGAGAAAVSGTATSATPKTPALSQVMPVAGIPGLYTLQITIQQDSNKPVSYDKFLDFLSRLEQNRRTAQVSSIVIQPYSKDRNQLSFTLTVDEFIKP